ncbi:MAG: hypothetical protein ACTSRZ_12780 [Promethearchaeota archaeon]
MVTEILLSPVAYLKILMHSYRFWNENIKEKKRAYIYGVLIGYVEKDIRYITNYIPLLHSKYDIDLERKHSIFMKIDKINQEMAMQQNPDFIIGWVKSLNKEDVVISPIDKKNQIYLQTAYHKNAITLFLLIPTLEYDWGISFRSFDSLLSEIDESSLMYDLDWNFDEPEDIDDLFGILKHLHLVKEKKIPLIKEYKEVLLKFK